MLICAGENKHSLQSDEKHYICKVLHPSQCSVWWSFAAVPKMCPSYPQVCTRDISIIITRIYFGEGNKASIISLGNCVKCPCYGFHEAEPFCDCHLKKINKSISTILCCLERMLCMGAPHLHIFDVTAHKRQNLLLQMTSKDVAKIHRITPWPLVNHRFVTEFLVSVNHWQLRLSSAFSILSPSCWRLNGEKFSF